MAATGLPLHCCICPKKPTFSDVSHLLTHVASKGHLSHYYKVKVRSSHEKESKAIIDTYDTWYADWHVEELMSHRMDMKDKKRSRGKSQVLDQRPSKKVKKEAELYDPFLFSQPDTDLDPGCLPALADDFNLFDIPYCRPRMHLWSTFRPASWNAVPLESSSPFMQYFDLPFEDLQPQSSISNALASEIDLEPSEAAKLKGVFWPGMDIFDAAPLATRKKRNQKKDISVLAHLEQNSLRVQPNEVVYTPRGAHSKLRTITGRVDFDSSPSRLLDPTPSPPTKRKAARKTTLKPREVVGEKTTRPRGRPRGSKSCVALVAPPPSGLNSINVDAQSPTPFAAGADHAISIKNEFQPLCSRASSEISLYNGISFAEEFNLHQALNGIASAGLVSYSAHDTNHELASPFRSLWAYKSDLT